MSSGSDQTWEGGSGREDDRVDGSPLQGLLVSSQNTWSQVSWAGSALKQEKAIGYGAFGVVWAVVDPNSGRQIALKKLSNVFQSTVAARRAYRELKMLSSVKHDNVLSAMDIVIPDNQYFNGCLYVTTELMQTDLHRIIVSPQPLHLDHIKVFTYQIFRGLKYLHSAHILHRDIKPGNILINRNCILKICDFGLARVEECDPRVALTQEVVTQYYRAPEILMGSRHYSGAVDVWAVGCIIAEMLTRKIFFQAKSTIQQLDLILNVVGTPPVDDLLDMQYACTAAREYVFYKPHQPANQDVMEELSKDCPTDEPKSVEHLLQLLLVFNPSKRASASVALQQPFVIDGRSRFHMSMCSCCKHPGNSRFFFLHEMARRRSMNEEDFLEPVSAAPFSYGFEDDLTNVARVRAKIFELRTEMIKRGRRSLHINELSPLYTKLTNSRCAQPSDASVNNAWD